MKILRYRRGETIAYGILEDESVEEISSTPFLPWERTGVVHDVSDLKVLAPCLPSKIIAIGVNYKEHAAEMGREIPAEPMFFYKPSTAVIGPEEEIVWPPDCEILSYEGELAVVIGAVAKNVTKSRWQEVVAGYTCSIDATARDLQAKDLQWGRAKGFDTSAPLGPWIETDADPSDLYLITKVNGEVRQDSVTSDLIFGVPELIEFVTSYVTLLPGDVIMTGTPSGVGALQAGDKIEVEIEDVGVLTATVRGR